MVAGGRSAAQTSGKVSGNPSHLGRGARNLHPPAQVSNQERRNNREIR